MNARVVEFEQVEVTVVPSRYWNSPVQLALKRIVEFALSLTALLVLSPLCLLLAIAIKLTSRGPIFFKCNWIGQHEIPFAGYKFRSMVMNADEMKADLMAQNEMNGPVFKITDDPRVTRLGVWMRRHSLDEIPQLFSVLKGDLSLVGPRPPLRTEYAQFTKWEKQKLLVKPGITCLWQVSGRNSIRDFGEWIRLDFEYISNWWIGLDAIILLKTVREVLAGSGK
jgi:lipopolysaccharide/colanic/teichoic acid biosynthesis glycosyltransferase